MQDDEFEYRDKSNLIALFRNFLLPRFRGKDQIQEIATKSSASAKFLIEEARSAVRENY